MPSEAAVEVEPWVCCAVSGPVEVEAGSRSETVVGCWCFRETQAEECSGD